MHDLSIVFVLAFIALHDLSLLVPRFNRMLVTLAAVGIALTGTSLLAPVLAPLAADIAVPAVVVAEVLIYRRGLRPTPKREQRRTLLKILLVLTVAGGLFILGRTDSPACDPTSLLQPHAGWHLTAAGAFALWWRLALARTPTTSTERQRARAAMSGREP